MSDTRVRCVVQATTRDTSVLVADETTARPVHDLSMPVRTRRLTRVNPRQLADNVSDNVPDIACIEFLLEEN